MVYHNAEADYPKHFTEIEEDYSHLMNRVEFNFRKKYGPRDMPTVARVWDVIHRFYPVPPAKDKFREPWFHVNKNTHAVIQGKEDIIYHLCIRRDEVRDGQVNGWSKECFKYRVPSYYGILGTFVQWSSMEKISDYWKKQDISKHIMVICMVPKLPEREWQKETYDYWYAPAKQVYEWTFVKASGFKTSWEEQFAVPIKGSYKGVIDKPYALNEKGQWKTKPVSVSGEFEFTREEPYFL